MASVVKTKLKSLCCDNGWSYGVFWRFDHRNPMLLTVEDAYFEEQLETAVNGVIQQVHLLGEGVIGQAAFTGKQRWINEDVRGEQFCCVDNTGLQDESEMHREFSAGIKTIGVIPVEKLGVVQVGAMKKIPESSEFLDKVKKLFREMGNIDGRLHLENDPSSLNNDGHVLNGLFASLLLSRSSHSGNLMSVNSDNHTDLTGDARSAEDLIPLLGHTWDKYSGDMVSMLGGVSNFNHQMQKPISHPDMPIASHEPRHLQPTSLMKYASSGTCTSSWSGGGSALTSLEPSLPQNFPHAYSTSTRKNKLTSFSSSVKSSCASSAVSTPSSSCDRGLVERKTMQDISGNSANNRQCAPHMQEICGQLPSVSSGQKRSADYLQQTEDCSNSCLVDDLSEWFSDLPEHGLFGMASSLDKSLAHSTALSSISSVIDRGDYTCELSINQATGSPWNSISNAFTMEEKTINIQNVEREVFDDFGANAGCKLEPEYYEDGGPWKGLFSELGLEDFFEGNQNSMTNLGFQESPPFAQRKMVEQPYNDSKQFQSLNLSCSGSMRTSMNPMHYLCKEKDIVQREAVFPKSQVGLWIDDSYSINTRGVTVMPPKRTEELMKAPRKRARPGESTRPRPKDRQQIQDRLKELRGIIPNGAKCSIDALLDRTIKHMLFLQNMMKYADKLKRADDSKLIGQGNNLVLKNERDGRDVGDGSRGGATWAYEVGGQAMVCPIVVEDLGPPGQMLIEMLCDDQGLFLEIADIIRGFGLDILKGEMGVQEDKIWSRFIVEANRHVTRMDVFWSLIQLVQETNSCGGNLTTQPTDAADSQFFSCNDYKESLLPLPIS
ncbi:transcription factor bHLH157-like [Syzygium oleosum]|uniref:transcription factor bHLH157-like n=1 Tax=Syzygium oleosum TaxID=219896 RepID=UPI0024BB4D74|nr:transcription factor bHLH157-like [Syzygium oleosum]